MLRLKLAIIVGLAGFTILSACSASKKALKQAREFEQAGLYVEAARQDLKALRKDPHFKEALVHLKSVAPKAYAELLDRGKNLESAADWDQAVVEYGQLHDLLDQFHRHGVVFETENVGAQLKAARQKAAQTHYAEGEAFEKNNQWQRAANAFLKADSFVENYNNALDKAIHALLIAGDRLLESRKYSRALKNYQRVLEIAPNHRRAKQAAAETYYRRGRQYFQEAQYREALKDFERIEAFVPGYKDSRKWRERALDKATLKVAVIPFLNLSRNYAADGYLLASEITSRCQERDLPFVHFLLDADVMNLLNKNRISLSRGVTAEHLAQIADNYGLDAIVWGKIREVQVIDKPASFKEYEGAITTTAVDSTGKEVEQQEPIYYRQYTKSRVVKMRADLQILDAHTSAPLVRQSYFDEKTDRAVWIAYQGSIYDLPRNKQKYLDAPRDPRPVPELVNDLILSMSKKMSRRVMQQFK